MSPIDTKPASILARYKKAVGVAGVGVVCTAIFVLTGIDINEEQATPVVVGIAAIVAAVLRNAK